ncbi:MAG: 2-alkenal reductase, partial [Burkholderiaceae bacterium]
MLRRLWLIFAQATTIGLAALFVVASLRPDWLDRRPRSTATPIIHLATAAAGAGGESPNSYSQAVQAAAPAVVNVYTTQTVRREAHPD